MFLAEGLPDTMRIGVNEADDLARVEQRSTHGRTNAQVQDALRGVKTPIGQRIADQDRILRLDDLIGNTAADGDFLVGDLGPGAHHLGRDRIGVLVVKAEEAAFGGEVLEDQIQDLSQHVVQVFAAHQGLGHLAVAPAPACRAQLVVERRADEGMVELVGARGRLM